MVEFDYFVLGEIAQITSSDGIVRVKLSNDGGTHRLFSPLERDLVGRTVIIWRGYVDDDNFGIDEVEMTESGQTVHFLSHLGGKLGYTVNFERRTWDLQQLKFMGLKICLPELASA